MSQTTINVGETATGVVLGAGDVQTVYGSAYGTVVNAGGTQIVALQGAHSAVDNTTVNDGGVLSIQSGMPTDVHLLEGGAISVPLLDTNYPPYLQYDEQSSVLTIHNSPDHIVTVQLSGDYGSNSTSNFSYFDYPADANPTIKVMGSPLCFCAGVHIMTPSGERLIEELREGDEVVTASGAVRIVQWIGRQTALATPSDRPVIVRPNALSDGVPTRSIRTTRCHSYLFRDVLIPIEQLVNGKTILFDDCAQVMKLFHLELDRHDILLAEGAPVESYRDMGNRAGFASVGGSHAEAGSMPTYAPVICRGPIVDRTKQRLAERAERLTKIVRLEQVAA